MDLKILRALTVLTFIIIILFSIIYPIMTMIVAKTEGYESVALLGKISSIIRIITDLGIITFLSINFAVLNRKNSEGRGRFFALLSLIVMAVCIVLKFSSGFLYRAVLISAVNLPVNMGPAQFVGIISSVLSILFFLIFLVSGIFFILSWIKDDSGE